jgi:SH3 domain protein
VNVLHGAATDLAKGCRGRVKGIFSLILFFFVLIATTAYAKTMYVTDTLNIMVRRQPGLDFKIVDQLSSNEKVNRIRAEESWSKISFGDNKVGWVLNRYLTEEIPKPLQIEDLRKRASAQAKKIETLEKENFTLKQKKVELTEKVSTLTVENQTLKEEPFRIMMLLTGVGIFLVGCVVTLILQRTGKSRRSRLSFKSL